MQTLGANRLPRLLFIAAIGANTLGCDRSPASPTPEPGLPPSFPGTLVGVTVFGPDFLKTHETDRIQARVVYEQNGSVQQPFVEKVEWTSDNPASVTVDVRGNVTAVAPGQANVTASFGGKHGTGRIRVVPNYLGTWEGNYQVTNCLNQTGDPRSCLSSSLDPVRPMRLTVTNQNRDQINGTLVLDTRPAIQRAIPVAGVIRLSGTLVVEASFPTPVLGLPDGRIEISNWNTLVDASETRMSGGFTETNTWTSFTGFPNLLRYEHELRTVARVTAR